MGLVVGPGRSARLIVARDKLDMTASGQNRTNRRMVPRVGLGRGYRTSDSGRPEGRLWATSGRRVQSIYQQP